MLTSATLAVGGGFDYIRKRLGMEHAREAVLPSHFDYQSQAVLYVPQTCPIRERRSSLHRLPRAFASCWRSRAAAPSCSSPATPR